MCAHAANLGSIEVLARSRLLLLEDFHQFTHDSLTIHDWHFIVQKNELKWLNRSVLSLHFKPLLEKFDAFFARNCKIAGQAELTEKQLCGHEIELTVVDH